GGEQVVMLAAVGIGGEILAPVLDPLEGRSKLARTPGEGHLLRQQDALVAEATAHVGRHHADLALVDAEALRQPRAHDVGLLRRGVDNELAEARVPAGNDAAALHRAHYLASGA